MYTAHRSHWLVRSCSLICRPCTHYILDNCHAPIYMFSESIIKYYYSTGFAGEYSVPGIHKPHIIVNIIDDDCSICPACEVSARVDCWLFLCVPIYMYDKNVTAYPPPHHNQFLAMVNAHRTQIALGIFKTTFSERLTFSTYIPLNISQISYSACTSQRLHDVISFQGVNITGYVMAIELFPPKQRTIFGVGHEFFWAIGGAMIPFFAYFLRDWRHLQLCVSLPGALGIFLWW